MAERLAIVLWMLDNGCCEDLSMDIDVVVVVLLDGVSFVVVVGSCPLIRYRRMIGEGVVVGLSSLLLILIWVWVGVDRSVG